MASTAALWEEVKLYGNLIHMFFAMKSLRRLHLSILEFLGSRLFSSGWIGMAIPKSAYESQDWSDYGRNGVFKVMPCTRCRCRLL